MTGRSLTLTARLSLAGLAALVLAIGGSADAAPSANGKIVYGSDRLDRLDPSFPDDTDLLDGGSGSDVLDGGAGEDVVRGGLGDDIVLARDRLGDRVDCGQGRDRLTADRIDRQRQCEKVLRR